MGLLTASFVKSSNCVRRSGIKTVYAADVNDITSFTKTTAADAYATITLKSTGVWRSYQFEENEGELTEVMSGQSGAFQWAQTLEFRVGGLSKTSQKMKKDFADASGCGMVLVVETMAGIKWVVGYSETGGFVFPAKLTEDNTTTGKALTDNSGSTLKIAAMSPEPMWTFTGTISAS